MSFLDLLKIEFMKVKRSKIVPLIFIAPLLVVVSGVASLSNYFTPEYTNAWPAMFIQSALVYAYYLLPDVYKRQALYTVHHSTYCATEQDFKANGRTGFFRSM